MTQRTEGPEELEDLLRRLDEGRQALLDAAKELDPELFGVEMRDNESIKRALERTADDINFYYGSLVAKALSLPQPPCMSRAEFGSLREATTSIQVAHRRFSNLLHDLVAEDLDKSGTDDNGSTYTLRQILEMAAAQYNYRAQQLGRLAERAVSEAG